MKYSLINLDLSFELHGSYASWKIPESSGIPPFPRAWKVLEINVCSGKFWKFDVMVLESS